MQQLWPLQHLSFQIFHQGHNRLSNIIIIIIVVVVVVVVIIIIIIIIIIFM